MATTTILDNLVAVGYDPKKIPAWVARSSAAQAKLTGQPQSGGFTPSASPVASVAKATPAVSVTTVEKPVEAPIVEDAEPVRLKPSLPAQPQQAKPAVNVLGPALDVPSQAVNAPSQAVNEQRQAVDVPGQRPRVTEQPAEEQNIVYIEGKPAVQMTDPSGRLTFRWAAQEDLAGPQPEGNQVGASV